MIQTGFEGGMFYKTEAIAAVPFVLKCQPSSSFYFFEDDLIAPGILVEVTLQTVAGFIPYRKRFPVCRSPFFYNAENGFRICFGRAGYLIIRIIGRARPRILSARADTAIAGKKKPMIRVAHDAHEKGRIAPVSAMR